MSNKVTPATRNENTPQKLRKSILPQEEIVLNITKNVTGSELGNVLQGVDAFTRCFTPEDQYMVAIKVEKILPQTTEDHT